MSRITRPYDRRVAVRVRKCVSQNQFGPLHSFGQNLVEIRTRPDIVQCGALDFGIRSALRDASPDDNSRTGFRGSRDQVMMLRSQARIGDLESVKHAQVDEAR